MSWLRMTRRPAEFSCAADQTKLMYPCWVCWSILLIAHLSHRLEIQDRELHDLVQHDSFDPKPTSAALYSACLQVFFSFFLDKTEALMTLMWYQVLKIDKPLELTQNFSLSHTHTHTHLFTYQNKQVCALRCCLQSTRPSSLLTNLLVTILQSREIKWGDQNQLAVRLRRGIAVQSWNVLWSSGAVMRIKATRDVLSLCFVSLLSRLCSVCRSDGAAAESRSLAAHLSIVCHPEH